MKQATVYKCELPEQDLLEQHFEECEFQEIGMHQMETAGFNRFDDGLFTRRINGWVAFQVRRDTKIIPTGSVRDEVKKRVKVLEANECRKAGRADRLNIKDEVMMEFCVKALVKQQIINAYYHEESQTLVVDSANKKLADTMTGRMIEAIGSIKATTIYMNGLVADLTMRLCNYVSGNHHATIFGDLTPSGSCKLTRLNSEEKKESVSFSGAGELSNFTEIIRLIEDEGFKVSQLGFSDEGMSFTLDDKFKIRKIANLAFEPDDTDDESYDAAEHELGVTLHLLNANIELLCKLFEYKRPEVSEAA